MTEDKNKNGDFSGQVGYFPLKDATRRVSMPMADITQSFNESPIIKTMQEISSLTSRFTPLSLGLMGIKTPYYEPTEIMPILPSGEDKTNILFVVGNGFDLDAGMKTGYSDFRLSNQWAKLLDRDDLNSFLRLYLSSKSKDSWLGLEEELKRYAMSVTSVYKDTIQYQNNSELDRTFFEAMCDTLKEYLSKCYESAMNNTKAAQMLSTLLWIGDSYLGVEQSNKVYINCVSFNYTDIDKVAQSMYPNTTFHSKFESIIHVHGNLYDGIILGTDESRDIPIGYEFLFKSWNENYRSHKVLDILASSDFLVFYGLSFGAIDLIYFYQFFRDICAGKYDSKRKHIYIVTHSNESRENILREIFKMGIPMMELKAHCYIEFIYTNSANNEDFNKLLDTLHQLKKSGKLISE